MLHSERRLYARIAQTRRNCRVMVALMQSVVVTSSKELHMYQKNLVIKFTILAVAISTASIANATNMRQVFVNSASGKWSVDQGGWRTAVSVNFTVNNAGPNHICSMKWTRDFWVTHRTVNAKFVNTVGTSENWKASETVGGQYIGTMEYIIICADLSGQQQVVSPTFGTLTTYGLTLQTPVGSTPFGW